MGAQNRQHCRIDRNDEGNLDLTSTLFVDSEVPPPKVEVYPWDIDEDALAAAVIADMEKQGWRLVSSNDGSFPLEFEAP